jgi:GxxExxY protein
VRGWGTTDEHRFDGLTRSVIGCAYEVSNTLGCGCLEKECENAMVVALRKAGYGVRQQVRYLVTYEGEVVGEYIADLVVEGKVLLELKAVEAFDDVHSAQCINLLRASGTPVCLLINFAKPKVQVRRFVNKFRS